MRVVLVAPPAAGKGTQAERIAARFGVASLSTGDLLRRHVDLGDDLGRRVQDLLEGGDLVPDELVFAALRRPLAEADRAGGWVLDGFPRTRLQAEWAAEHEFDLEPDAVVVLEVDPAELLRRFRHRAVTGDRIDDTEETFRHRLDVYREESGPLLDYYAEHRLLRSVDANGSVDEVAGRIHAALAG